MIAILKDSKNINKLFFTGADCFILALEKHNQHQGASGNTCRYVLELDGKLDATFFKKKINQNKILQQLSSLSIHRKSLLSKARWKSNTVKDIEVNTHESDLFLPNYILTKNFSIDESNLFSFDIINRSNGNSCLILSWHHLLMDGYGSVLFLKQIVGSNKILLSTEEEKVRFNFKNIQRAAKAKFFIDKTSKNELSGITSNVNATSVTQKIKIINFTTEETIKIEHNALKLGAKFGVSPLYLACSANTVKQILEQRNIPVKNFWIPVPQNKRKKGSQFPLLSNHISFLFYRIISKELTSLKQTVTSINNQMVNQIRAGLPKAYDVLLSLLKRIPSSLYYQLIKRPKGNSLASFLFTIAEEHPQDLLKFEGLNVINALSIPPNNFNPGLTFAFMKFNNCIQIMILSFEEILSEKEIANLETQLKHELITGKSLN